MKILFITMNALEMNSSATIQNKGIIRGLSELGHEIDTITLRPNENSINYDSSMNDIKNIIRKSYYIDIKTSYQILMSKKNNLKKENSNNLSKSIKKDVRKIIKKIYNSMCVFDAQKINVKGVTKVKIDFSQYDVIISSSDPKSSHLIAEKVYVENKNCKAKWIQYWGDPMLNDITRKSGIRDILVKYYENKLIKNADKIVYASPLTLDKQKDIFPKFAFKMNYASQAYANVINKKHNYSEKIKDDNILLGYFGSYDSSIRNINPLYNAVKYKKYKMDICGSSDILLKSTENINIFGMLSYEETLNREEKADILICICNNRGTQIPGKIYYCTKYIKPIIIILDGEYKNELRKYFETFNRFILCENNECAITEAIEIAKNQINILNYKISEKLTPKYMASKILE